ncbi:hypothetical protein QAD02_020789 [Eretmocerus hayati]|uniref:Uncharacterized protein n=1 Tax=Eretmocerus hayati TaxID=131215 RepID=A0ACC2PNC7_9HYME|nr:hypothetical protein QAD02_020789 [Eretmocerus hayati]
MKLYERQVNALKEQVTLCEATSRQQIEYIFLDEMLTRKLMDLDNVVVENDESVRQIRKRLVSSLQESINLLESKVPPMEEQTQSARERRKRELTQNENLAEHKKSSEEPLPQTSDQNNVDRRSQLQQAQIEKIQEHVERFVDLRQRRFDQDSNTTKARFSLYFHDISD